MSEHTRDQLSLDDPAADEPVPCPSPHDRAETRGPSTGGTDSLDADGPLVGVPSVPSYARARKKDPHVEFGTDFALRLERRWGADEQGSFPCPLPGHPGRARLGTPTDEGDVGLRVLCNCQGRWRSLGEVRANQAYGADVLRSNIEIAIWTRRLAYELECFEPVAVPLAYLPADAPSHAVEARRGFQLLVGLRWADRAPRPVAYSVRFCAAWCSLTHAEAALGVRALIEHEVITVVGKQGRIRLYEPAPVPPAERG